MSWTWDYEIGYTEEELAEEEVMKQVDYNDSEDDEELSECCGAEITEQWFCMCCYEHVL